MRPLPAKGAGLGLRRALLGPLQESPDAAIDFFEVAPENWINVGGRLGDVLERTKAPRHGKPVEHREDAEGQERDGFHP